MCTRWFTKGNCFTNCNNKNSHIGGQDIPAKKKTEYLSFLNRVQGNPTLWLYRSWSSNIQPPAKLPDPPFHSRTKERFSTSSKISSSHRLPFPTIIKDNAYKYTSSLPINQLFPNQGTITQAASTLQWNLNPNHDLFSCPYQRRTPCGPTQRDSNTQKKF